jgi:hypothetical protein
MDLEIQNESGNYKKKNNIMTDKLLVFKYKH